MLRAPGTQRGRTARARSSYDPGGPGVSGADYATNPESLFGPAVLEHYDIVGLDPRGVGDSDPVECLPDSQLDAVLTGDPDPDTPAEVKQGDARLRKLGRGCVEQSGGVARHISTVEVAKDLDVLRAAMGESKLTYFGASYGTAIGATYADLFPKNVGRMVLDGALDPRSSTLDLNLVQAHGFETALRAYVGACVARGSCFLGSTVDEGTRRIRQFLDQVEKQPLPAGTRELNVGNAFYGIGYPLYNKAAWGVLDKAFQNAFNGDGSLMMALADAYLRRQRRRHVRGQLVRGVLRDQLPRPRRRDPQLEAGAIPARRSTRRRRRSGAASSTACPRARTGRCTPATRASAVHATGAAPILVIGTTRDPATPLVWAKALAKQLDNAVLVTRDGDGHTGYRQGSQCTDAIVEAYLVSGTVPKHNVRCA